MLELSRKMTWGEFDALNEEGLAGILSLYDPGQARDVGAKRVLDWLGLPRETLDRELPARRRVVEGLRATGWTCAGGYWMPGA